MNLPKRAIAVSIAVVLTGCASFSQEQVSAYTYVPGKAKALFSHQTPYYVPTSRQISSHVSRNGVRAASSPIQQASMNNDEELRSLREQIAALTATVTKLLALVSSNQVAAGKYASNTPRQNTDGFVKVSSIQKVSSTTKAVTKSPVNSFRIRPVKTVSAIKPQAETYIAAATVPKKAKDKLKLSKRTYKPSRSIASIPILPKGRYKTASSSRTERVMIKATKPVKKNRGIVKGESIDVVVKFKHQKMRNYFMKVFQVAGYKGLFPGHSPKSNEWVIYLGRYNSFADAYSRYQDAGAIATRGSVEMIHREKSYAI